MSLDIKISELAKEFETSGSVVVGVLDDLGLAHDATSTALEADELAIVKEELKGKRGLKEITLAPNANPRDIAAALGVTVPEIQKALMGMKIMAAITMSLKQDVAIALVEKFGFVIRWQDSVAKKPAPVQMVSAVAVSPKAAAQASEPVVRPPVVTILGHVDHGKTSLLDYIRKANVAGKEYGGITQHIGAYQTETDLGKITFLDTPGHAAFTAMRARGAQITDIAILVVAADDGIMPQTIEAIGHVLNAKVPMIVAVNKCDKPGANPDRVLQQLTEHSVVPEAYGGNVGTCNVSALTGEGVPELLERILLEAEVMELKADPKAEVKGVVVEAKLDKGRGPVATLLVQEGTLKVGQSIVVGNSFGKIKAMTDYRGERINEAGPSTPVEVLGLNDVPGAGDFLEVAADERGARNLAEGRATDSRIQGLMGPKRAISLRDIRRQVEQEGFKTLNLIVKADVQGSVEAVRGMLEKVRNDEVETKIIYSGVGTVTESDILLASASDAIVVGFNVKPEGGAKKEAEKTKVEIRCYTIIYELVEDIEAAVKGMLEPKFEEQYLGKVEIKMVFKLTKQGHVAGCYVLDGKVTRGCLCRVTRGKELVFSGKIDSLKNIKQDAREMIAGQECGIQFDHWTGYKEGDIIEAYEMVQVMD